MEEVMIEGWLRELTYSLNIQKELGEELYVKYRISHSHYLLLGEIDYEGDVTQYELSRKLHFTKQRVNQLARELINEGFMLLTEEKSGRRRKYLNISQKGKEVLFEINKGKYETIKFLLEEDELYLIQETFEKLKKLNELARKRAKEKGKFNTKYL